MVSTKELSESLWRNYGSFVARITTFCLGDTVVRYEQIDRHIVNGQDKDALAFRQAVTENCNMTAIAGAIVAQLAVTSLSLPRLSSTHWVARACFLFAITAGCLSVYYCCVLQRELGAQYRPSLIRKWLSIPHFGEEGSDDSKAASLPKVFLVSAPSVLMEASIFGFLLGLAIYLGFVWKRALDGDAGPGDSRDVFITFIVGTGLCSLPYSITSQLDAFLRGIAWGLKNGSGNSRPPFLQSLGMIEPIQPVDHEAGQATQAPQDTGKASTAGSLSAALEAAAQAHLQCAEAERIVATEYARASQDQHHVKAEDAVAAKEPSEHGR